MDDLNLKDVLNSLSIVIASFTAIYGINSWRKEARWKRKYELAEEVLVLVYEVREAMRYIRNPWQTEGLVDGKRMKALDIVIQRRDKYKDNFARLNSMKYRFMVIHDKNAEKLFDRMDALLVEIVAAAWNLDNRYYKAYDENIWDSDEERLKNVEKMHEMQKIIWKIEENNEFDKKVDLLVKEFNEMCEAVIKRGSFNPKLKDWFSFIKYY